MSEEIYNWEYINSLGEYDIKKILTTAGKYQDWISLVPTEKNDWIINWDGIENKFNQLVNAMRNCPQDASYHAEGDVWTHTKMVLEELVKENIYKNLSDQDKEIIFFTVFMHDIGKPFVSKIDEETGRIASKSHSKRGAKDARLILFFAEAPIEIREKIVNIITEHQKPFTWIKKADVFSLRKMSLYVPLNLLYLMALSDARGRITLEKDDIIERVELFKMEAEFQNCFDKPWDYPFTCSHAKMLYWEGMGNSHEDRPVFWEGGSDVIILAGLPASGKDTWCENFGKDLPIISLDAIREEFGVSYEKNMGHAIQEMIKKVKKLLALKAPFIWNATHLSDSQRAKTLRLLREYGAKTRFVYLEANIDNLIQRNSNRDTTLSNQKLINMVYKWQPPLPFEAHEVVWFIGNKPCYMDYLTSKKDEESPWKFESEHIKRKFKR